MTKTPISLTPKDLTKEALHFQPITEEVLGKWRAGVTIFGQATFMDWEFNTPTHAHEAAIHLATSANNMLAHSIAVAIMGVQNMIEFTNQN